MAKVEEELGFFCFSDKVWFFAADPMNIYLLQSHFSAEEEDEKQTFNGRKFSHIHIEACLHSCW